MSITLNQYWYGDSWKKNILRKSSQYFILFRRTDARMGKILLFQRKTNIYGLGISCRMELKGFSGRRKNTIPLLKNKAFYPTFYRFSCRTLYPELVLLAREKHKNSPLYKKKRSTHFWKIYKTKCVSFNIPTLLVWSMFFSYIFYSRVFIFSHFTTYRMYINDVLKTLRQFQK